MDKFILTKEIIVNSTSYMPLADKTALAKTTAEMCVVKAKTHEDSKIGEGIFAAPNLLKEDAGIKKKCLMHVFLSAYLNIQIPMLTEQLYDYYAGSFIFGQIEAFKNDPDVREKVFNLLSDWREFKSMVDDEIYAKIKNASDPIARVAAGIAVTLTPENVQKMTEELKKAAIEKSFPTATETPETTETKEEK